MLNSFSPEFLTIDHWRSTMAFVQSTSLRTTGAAFAAGLAGFAATAGAAGAVDLLNNEDFPSDDFTPDFFLSCPSLYLLPLTVSTTTFSLIVFDAILLVVTFSPSLIVGCLLRVFVFVRV